MYFGIRSSHKWSTHELHLTYGMLYNLTLCILNYMLATFMVHVGYTLLALHVSRVLSILEYGLALNGTHIGYT